MQIDASRPIAETPIIPLRCVDSLLSKGLRYVFCAILDYMYNVFQRYVDLGSEILTG